MKNIEKHGSVGTRGLYQLVIKNCLLNSENDRVKYIFYIYDIPIYSIFFVRFEIKKIRYINDAYT